MKRILALAVTALTTCGVSRAPEEIHNESGGRFLVHNDACFVTARFV